MLSINNIKTITNTTVEKPSLTYKLDIDKGRIIGRVDGIEAMQQYIRKTLITPRFGCLIYGDDYGSEINAVMVANKWNRAVEKKLLPKLVKDALGDSRIIDVYDFDFADGEDCIYISFKADTVFGVIEIKEAIKIV